jgi:hypothetical protein
MGNKHLLVGALSVAEQLQRLFSHPFSKLSRSFPLVIVAILDYDDPIV